MSARTRRTIARFACLSLVTLLGGACADAAGRPQEISERFAAIGLQKLDGLPGEGWIQPVDAVEIRVDPVTALVLARGAGRESVAIHPVAGSDAAEVAFDRAVWVGTGTAVSSYGPEVRGALAVAAVAAPANLAQEMAEMRARVVAAREAGAIALVVARPDQSGAQWSRLGAGGKDAPDSSARGESIRRTLGAGASPLGLPVVMAGGAILEALAGGEGVGALLARAAPAPLPLEGVLRVAFRSRTRREANVLGYHPGAGARFRDEVIAISAPLEGPGAELLVTVARSFADGSQKAARSLLFAALADVEPDSPGARAVTDLPARIVALVDIGALPRLAPGEVRLELGPANPRLADLARRLAASRSIALTLASSPVEAAAPADVASGGGERDAATVPPRLTLRSGDSVAARGAAAPFLAALLEQISAVPLAHIEAHPAATVTAVAPTPGAAPTPAPAPVTPGIPASAAAATSPTPDPGRDPVPGDTLRDRREHHLRRVRQLTFGGENAEAYWSMDGKQLILQSTRPPYSCDQIFVLDPGTLATRMVSTGTGRTTCSWFFPDRERILYASTHLTGPDCPPRPDHSQGYVWALDDFDIFTARSDGGDLQRITWTPRYDAEATMTEDGSRVVFTSVRDGDLEIYSMNPDGTDQTRLTRTPGYDGGAVFSPDGRRIVYRAHHPTAPADLARYRKLLDANLVEPRALEIMTMNADGSGVRAITRNGAANFAPCWTRDGRRILFSSNLSDPRGRNFDLYLVDADGQGLERVTFDSTFDGFPMFSPDGRTLVWASNRNSAVRGETNIFIADWVE